MRKRLLVVLFGVLFLSLIVWAWIDGGERPLRDISEPLTLPGDAS